MCAGAAALCLSLRFIRNQPAAPMMRTPAIGPTTAPAIQAWLLPVLPLPGGRAGLPVVGAVELDTWLPGAADEVGIAVLDEEPVDIDVVTTDIVRLVYASSYTISSGRSTHQQVVGTQYSRPSRKGKRCGTPKAVHWVMSQR